MKKTAKRKKIDYNIETVCKTLEEQVFMLIVIVYCQYFYRKFRRDKKWIRIAAVVEAARKAYNNTQATKSVLEQSGFGLW